MSDGREIDFIGSVKEARGHATIIHSDGVTDEVGRGTAVYKGDVIQTASDGSVHVVFIDKSSAAVPEQSHLSVNQVFHGDDPPAAAPSLLQSIFSFTGGLFHHPPPPDPHDNGSFLFMPDHTTFI